MALLRAVGLKRPYEPKPRFMHYAGAVEGECFIFAGMTVDFLKTKEELSSTIEVFDQYLEQWRALKTTGSPPKGLCAGGCCFSPSGDLYVYGGLDEFGCLSGLYKLTSLEWSQLSAESDTNCPMSKSGCGMVCFNNSKKIAIIGGNGPFPSSGPPQPGSSFIKNEHFTDGCGWTNEIHFFDAEECKYSTSHCVQAN